MTDHDALYRAMIARPEDDTPRLVYADWLEEHGREEQAEFIRLDCRLEILCPDESEYTELLDRRKELRLWLRAHSPGPQLRLKGGLSVASSRDWWKPTHRGFPSVLMLLEEQGGLGGLKGIRRFVKAMEKAFATIPTRWLVIDHIAVEELAELLKYPVLGALERLTLNTDEQSVDEAATLIANCRNLQNLRGAGLFPFGEVGANALGHSEHLGRIEWLALDTDNFSPASIRSLFTGTWFHNLRHLILRGPLTMDAFEELCRLPSFPRLHTLNLSGNSFPVSSWQVFARSRTFPQLTQLELDGTDMSSGQVAALAAANGFNLCGLDLGYCGIGDEGARALVRAPWVGSLQRLDLAGSLLGSTGAAAIAKCPMLSQLKYLNLAANPIDAAGLRAIARSPNLRNLTTLLLRDCSARNGTLPPACFHEFLEKLNLPNLRHLDLSNMLIGSRAARLLTEEKFRKLTRLGLAKCKLTDAAVSTLLHASSLQNLIELRLDNNGLKTGVEPLTDRRMLPRLSMCNLTENPIVPDLSRKLGRRPGVFVSGSRSR